MTDSDPLPPQAPELRRQNAMTEEQWTEIFPPADPATPNLPSANPDPNSDDLPPQ